MKLLFFPYTGAETAEFSIVRDTYPPSRGTGRPAGEAGQVQLLPGRQHSAEGQSGGYGGGASGGESEDAGTHTAECPAGTRQGQEVRYIHT